MSGEKKLIDCPVCDGVGGYSIFGYDGMLRCRECKETGKLTVQQVKNVLIYKLNNLKAIEELDKKGLL